MTKIKLSAFQIYSMVVLYNLGSASILFIAREAKQDAWISILLGGTISIINFVFLYGSIFKLNKDDPTYYDTINKLFGKILGNILILIYALYFIYISLFILRDIVEITGFYILNQTPRGVIVILEIFIIFYGIQKGLETLFRTSELYFFVTILCYILVIFFLSLSGVVHFEYLFPILENGIKPVIKATPPLFLTIPFGEIAIFIGFLPLVKNKNGIKAGVLGLITVILIMLLITIFLISILGPYLAYNNKFPVVVMIRLINVGNFIQRLDALVILIFLNASVFQILLLLRMATKNLQVVLKLDNKKWIVIPLLILVYFGTYFIGESRREYLRLGTKITPAYISPLFEIIFPLIILLLSIYRNIKKKKKQKNAASVDAASF